ncbi:hypothetical protein T11_16336 [Trichinella zimbabwensis]|uniref:Uncharacterized protein n=1 Tax=Trichinella zimbabwensis TaxID=268475 RepID=A0A0V1HTZ3_9BILA|nr:hypothetical protein T11_16336 [Trichinella zimbabwensis]
MEFSKNDKMFLLAFNKQLKLLRFKRMLLRCFL